MQYSNSFFFPLRKSALKRHPLQHVLVLNGDEPFITSQFFVHYREKKKNKSAKLKVVFLVVRKDTSLFILNKLLYTNRSY